MNNPFKHFEKILKAHINEQGIKELPLRWKEPHRRYHTVAHLIDILKEMENDYRFNDLDVFSKHALCLAAFFHDVVYKPLEKNNEDLSIAYFLHCYKNNNECLRDAVCDLIATTKSRKRPINRLHQIFWDADNAQFKKNFPTFLRIEKMIRQEFSVVPKEKYKEGRIAFLESCIGTFGTKADINLMKLIDYVKST